MSEPCLPSISVVVPCYNEEQTIQKLLEALRGQTCALDQFEVVISDGLSTDSTRSRIQAFSSQHPEVKIFIVDNINKTIPAGLNRAIEAAQGIYIIRLDAHSSPYPDDLERCVRALQQGLGEIVGGVWEIRPGGDGWQARGIAAAAAHPLGVGDAHYRFTNKAQYVDTVPFGAYTRDLFMRLGGFNESLLTNEDYEFNTRLRLGGGRIWLDPEIRSIYFARANISQLLRQYARYGFWKAKMIRQYPGTLRWRQALPPLFVLSLVFLIMAGLLWIPVWWLLGLELMVYFMVLMVAGIQAAYCRKDWSLVFGVPLAIACMHLTWGSAFLGGLVAK